MFVILLKSRSRTHHLCTPPKLGVDAKTYIPSRSTQLLGENTKNMLHRFPSDKGSKLLLLSLKCFTVEKRYFFAKVIHRKEKKRKEKKLKKRISV
jgi:hypothetical protein